MQSFKLFLEMDFLIIFSGLIEILEEYKSSQTTIYVVKGF